DTLNPQARIARGDVAKDGWRKQQRTWTPDEEVVTDGASGTHEGWIRTKPDAMGPTRSTRLARTARMSGTARGIPSNCTGDWRGSGPAIELRAQRHVRAGNQDFFLRMDLSVEKVNCFMMIYLAKTSRGKTYTMWGPPTALLEDACFKSERERKGDNERMNIKPFSQLRDTAEALQTTRELLVRLKEAEEAAAIGEKSALLAEETEKANQEID
ncbi:Kinesin motor domain containing protein, partial [Musa troglodytarum]